MAEPKTVGEAVEQHGFCEVMLRIVDLAKHLGRIPAGEWDYRFASDPKWRICLNGGTQPTWTPTDAPAVERFYAYLEYNGWPAGIVNAAGGSVALNEDRIIAAIEREIAHVQGGRKA
jgi:hypothetical protein